MMGAVIARTYSFQYLELFALIFPNIGSEVFRKFFWYFQKKSSGKTQ